IRLRFSGLVASLGDSGQRPERPLSPHDRGCSLDLAGSVAGVRAKLREVTEDHRLSSMSTSALWSHSPPATDDAMRRYVVADVFTSTPLEGNQLAVFTDGRGLSPERMQNTARE